MNWTAWGIRVVAVAAYFVAFGDESVGQGVVHPPPDRMYVNEVTTSLPPADGPSTHLGAPHPFVSAGSPEAATFPGWPIFSAPDIPFGPLVGPPSATASGGWTWFPHEQIYPSYLAGLKEPRLGTVFFHDADEGWLWDSTLGGRVGFLRYGDPPRTKLFPTAIQWDVEGAATPRLDIEDQQNLVAADFRAGTLLAASHDRWRAKFGFYHISSHLGDEFMLVHPEVLRNNYSRDELVLGLSYFPLDALRLYAEAGWAFHYTDPAEPWEFQFGLDYSPISPRGSGPFFAANGHLRQEVDFGGHLVVQTGWQWRDQPNGPLFRAGLQYLNGMSNQLQFYNRFENQVGAGIWYDF